MKSVIKDMDACTGCGCCENICPHGAIKISTNREGFLYPLIDSNLCVECGACTNKCPNGIIDNKTIRRNDFVKLYSAYSEDEKTRLMSSSGGIFYSISEYVIAKRGVVFGAEFDDDFNVKHGYTDKINDIQRFQTSKYVQSYLGDNFKKCKSFLEEGRLVFFTGTSCQIGGLYAFLGKKYPNLLTADLICSGNTSSGLWNLYVKHMEKKYKSRVRTVNFRDKKYGWDRFSLKISFENGKVYRRIFPNDAWAYFFLNHYAMRKCCYKCEYKGIDHKADFTLGDFWGVRERFYELYGKEYDDKGLSFVLVNTEKALGIWKRLNGLDCRVLPLNTGREHNTTIDTSAKEPVDRIEFYEDFLKSDFDLLENKYVKIPTWKKCNWLYDTYWKNRIYFGDLYRKIMKKVKR